MSTTVVNIKQDEYDYYCGRGGVFGNPFVVGRDGSRDECIEKFRDWVKTQPAILAKLPTLKGKRLGCFCAPQRCHCEVLAELADTEYTYQPPEPEPEPPQRRILDLSAGTHIDLQSG